MAVNADEEFWREFISLYKEMPELWQVKNESYNDRHKKNNAYGKLVDLMKKKNKNANKEMVKRKLNTIRGCYRREFKKAIKSEKSCAGVDDVYVPSLWYFNELKFLNDQLRAEGDISTCGNADGTMSSEMSEVVSEKNSKLKKRKEIDEPDEFLQSTIHHLKNIDDDSEIYGRAWVAQFRQLAPDQQIHAKKAMDDILYQGLLGRLPQPEQSTSFYCSTTEVKPSYDIHV